MTDDIRMMSDLLARDPSNLVFVQLGEALRRKGQLELAYRVAARGLERHPRRADAHDLVARIAVDRGDFARARSEWETVLAIAPGHSGAQKGLGFLFFQQGALEESERYLAAALAADPSDRSLAAALDTVRAAASEARDPRDGATAAMGARWSAAMAAPAPPFAPAPADARALFRDVLGEVALTALLLDADGLVVAGSYFAADGTDLGADVGAQLSGVSDEAARAVKHLDLGRWRRIVFEAQHASLAMAPSGPGVLLVAAPSNTPLGFVRRLLERALDRARHWMERGT